MLADNSPFLFTVCKSKDYLIFCLSLFSLVKKLDLFLP